MPCLFHQFKLLITFTDGTVGIGAGLLELKGSLVDFNGVFELIDINQGVSFVEIGGSKILFYEDGIVVCIDGFFIPLQFMISVAQVIPGGIGVGIAVDVLQIKTNAFFLSFQHVVANSKLV